MTELTKESGDALIEKVLQVYSPESAENRKEHLYMVGEKEEIKGSCVTANKKSIPGLMTVRGCAFAGAKGVVWGPVKDVINVSHGPIGCGQYSWGTRRNYSTGINGIDNFGVMHITSDFQEKDIVFGGDKKLAELMREAKELFPLARGISVLSECPVGLIGDDIEAVSNEMSKELEMPVIPVRCEGFRGVSQSLGHHIANDAARDYVLGKVEPVSVTDYDVNLIGDYNIGGDAWTSRVLLEEIGLRVTSQWTGDGTIQEIAAPHKAKLNLIHCYRSMNYICRHMEETYGIPWMEFNFFGPTKTTISLRAIADKFDDKIKENAEKVIEKYKAMQLQVIEKYKPRLDGKTVMLYVGGLRPRHMVGAYEDLGMKVIATGFEFGHSDDYERTVEDLTGATLVYDDVTEYELENFIKELKPDLIGSGIKEKYALQKLGVPFRQMHSWDYSGPYHGYHGFPVFARDMDMAVNAPVFKKIATPWKTGSKETK